MAEKSPTVSWTRAKLEVLEPKDGGNGSVLETINFPFNPKEWKIDYATEWKTESDKSKKAPPEFKGTKPSSVKLDMFLDASMEDNGDISATVAKLRKLLDPHPQSVQQKKPSPPHVRFGWGQAIAFQGYVSAMSVTYTLFRENGTPVRGTVGLTLNEFPRQNAGQNPTSGSLHLQRSHRVVHGDTLASIAYREYGDPGRWRLLADANPIIDDPLRLLPGTSVMVPEL